MIPVHLTVVFSFIIFHMVDSYRVDSSINRYKVEGKICHFHNEPCKKVYSRKFECKCPTMRPLCVSEGRYYDGRCIPEAWFAYGRLWIQP